MAEEALMPNLDKKVFGTIRKVKESRPKSEAEQRAEAITSLDGYSGWEAGLKPYIQVRIESLKAMSEVPMDGSETVEEIGLKAVVCSAISNELQDLLNMVQVNVQVYEEKRKKEKERIKKMKGKKWQ